MKRPLILTLSLTLLAGTLAALAAEGTAPESFQIRNQKFGNLLRPEDANSADGTRLVLYPAQAWKCLTWKMHPAGEGLFHLQNHFTSKTFAAEAKSKAAQPPVVQVPFAREAKDRPVWRFTKLPDGLYQVTEAKSGQTLTAVASDGGDARIVTAPWQEKAEQKWELLKTDPAKLSM